MGREGAGHPKPLKEGRKKKEKERETGGDQSPPHPTPASQGFHPQVITIRQ